MIEHTGDIYPCDFFVEPELLLGNVHDRRGAGAADGAADTKRTNEAARADKAAGADKTDYPERDNPFLRALEDPRHREFVRRKARWAPECVECRYRWLCGGDCPKMRPPHTPGGSASYGIGNRNQTAGTAGRDGLSALCSGWQAFYDHTLSDFARLSRAISPEVTGKPPVLSPTKACSEP